MGDVGLLAVGFYNVGRCAFVCAMGLYCNLCRRPLIHGFDVLILICCSVGFAIARKEVPAPLYGNNIFLRFCKIMMSPF